MADRIINGNVKAISTLTRIIEKSDNQMFCSTQKSWELWQIEPAMRIKRWNSKDIYWIFEEKE